MKSTRFFRLSTLVIGLMSSLSPSLFNPAIAAEPATTMPSAQAIPAEPTPSISLLDKAINRHLLTEYGGVKNWVEANATLARACEAISLQGGGIVVVPQGIDPNFFPQNTIQDLKTKAGVLVEDYRGGVLRYTVLSEGQHSASPFAGGSVIYERQISNDIAGQGGGYTVAIANQYRGGVNSINDVILRDAPKGPDAKIYINSLRGMCPGNYFYMDGVAGRSEGTIKTLGMDGDEPFFTVDLQFDHKKGDRFYNKNWLGGLQISDVHNADDQSGSLTIDRKSYGSGDTFGIMVGLDYAGDIMSAGGDEGGNLITAEVKNDVDLFWGETEAWDPATCKLVFKYAGAQNHIKIGTSRPIINMNPKKWMTAGKVIIPLNGYLYKGIPSAIIGNKDVPWDASVIGKYICIDEPSERIEGNQWNGSGPVGSHTVRRWFHITNLVKRADGLWNMGIETVWWGNYRGGQPRLFRQENYNTSDTNPKELSYIITTGSFAIDVRHALGPALTYIGHTPAERTIVLAPFQQSKDAFEPGDPICQPPGPTPWVPTAFRARFFNQMPALMPGAAYEANNYGATSVGGAFVVSGSGRGQTIAQIEKTQNDGVMPWGAGLSVQAATAYAIFIGGPVKYAAIFIEQNDAILRPIIWHSGAKGSTRIYGRPVGGDFVIEPTGNIDFSRKSTIQQSGLSGSQTAARNLRGINVPVPGAGTELIIKFAVPEADADYAVMTEISWITNKAIKNKTTIGFTVVFDKATPAPTEGGTLDWFLVR